MKFLERFVREIRYDSYAVQGMPELLLPYALVADGVLLQRDGSFLASWAMSGPDFIAASPEEIAAHADRLNRALQLGSGWMIQVDAIRHEIREYLPPGEFPDAVSRMIDVEREQKFKQPQARFVTDRFLTLTYLPPLETREKLHGFLFEGAGVGGTAADRALEAFVTRVDQFERLCSSLLQLRRLKDENGYNELLRFLRYQITGDDHPFLTPAHPVGLNDVLGVDLVTGFKPIIDGKHTRIISVDAFPPESFPGVLRELDAQPVEYRWSTRAMPLDAFEAKELLRSLEEQHKGTAKRGLDIVRGTPRNTLDAFAGELAGEAYANQAKALRSRVQYMHYTSTIVVMDADAEVADRSTRMLRKAVQNVGFGARLEDINAVDAWLGSLAGQGYRDVRRFLFNTLNLAHLLPISTPWCGSVENPGEFLKGQPALMGAVTTGSTPFWLNTHTRTTGHTLVLGPSGTGKTTFVGFNAIQFLRYPGAQVFVFDRKQDLYPVTMLVGGEHYDIAGGSGDMCFAPLSHLETAPDVAWAVEWIEGLCEINRLLVSPDQHNLIFEAVRNLQSGHHRTLTHFLVTVQDEAVRDVLRPYTRGGPFGSLFDGEADAFETAGVRWVTFETEALLGLSERVVIPALLYLFRRVESCLTGAPTLVVLDEAWSYLEHPLFQRKLTEWLRTFRSRNTSLMFATQQVGDISSSKIADLILDNCPTKILLPNAEAANPVSADFYRRMGMNAHEIALLCQAIPRKHYYYLSGEHRRLIDLDLGPVARAVVGVGGVRREQMRHLISRFGADWRAEWFRLMGLPGWSQYLRALERKEEEELCVG